VRDEWYKGLQTARDPGEIVRLWREVGAAEIWMPELGANGGRGGLDLAGEVLGILGEGGRRARECGFVIQSGIARLGIEIGEVLRELVDDFRLPRDRERRQVVADVLMKVHVGLPDRLDAGDPVQRRE
jgi:hypothetical protein